MSYEKLCNICGDFVKLMDIPQAASDAEITNNVTHLNENLLELKSMLAGYEYNNENMP